MYRSSHLSNKVKRKEYYEKMRETSRIVNPLILDLILPIKEKDNSLYNFIINAMPFKKRVEKENKLRPFVMRLAYEASGGTNWHDISYVCAVFELLNIFTYLINAGLDGKQFVTESSKEDYFLSGSVLMELVLSLQIPGYPTIEDLLKDTDKEIWAGQSLNLVTLTGTEPLNWEHKKYEQIYIERCSKLTGKSLENIAAAGAILAGAPEEYVLLLRSYGELLGTTVQIINDIGDFVPPANTHDHEKVPGDQYSDIRASIITYPTYYAIRQSSDEDKEVIMDAIGNPDLSNGKAENITKILVGCGAIAETKRLAGKYARKAKKHLKFLPDSVAKEYLEVMTHIWEVNKYLANLLYPMMGNPPNRINS